MKRIGALLALLALGLFASPMLAEEERPWFDVHNCAICKNISGQEGLMENVEWEAHVVANGMLSIATVPAEYEEVFARAHEGINETVAKMQSGQPMEICGYCMSYGKLAMSGARMEQVQSKVGHIGLVTSDNPEVVAMIHEHAKRTIAEQKTWEAQLKGGS